MEYFHVWFSTWRRKWLLQGDVLEAVREMMPTIAAQHGINLVEFEAIVDHAHLLIQLDKESDLPRSMNLLKGASARRIFLRFPELKLDAQTSSFWQTGYASKKVPGRLISTTKRYIRTQWDRLEKYER